MRLFFRNVTLTSAVWLIARWLVAYEFLTAGSEKLFGAGSAVWVGPKAGTAVAGFLQGALKLATGAHPAVAQWYASLISSVFLPNAVVFSYLVSFGEFLVGIALFLGIFTRFSALMGLVMAMSYFYAGTVSTNPYVLPLLFSIILLGVYAGHFGVDGLVLAKRLPFFASPAENEPARGAAKVWETIIPFLVIFWIILMLVVLIAH
jgi:thiosulfate dehydrogenase [quinone] large subunit